MEQLSTINNLELVNPEKIETIQYIIVRLGEEQYGIDIRFIDNIVRMQRMTRIPKVPAYLKGVINLRGEVLPVMSLRLKMGLPADEITRASRIIILKLEQEGNVGIIVDEVKEVITLNVDEIEKLSNDAKDGTPNFVNGVGKRGNDLISLLDLSTITLEDGVSQ